MVRLDMLPPMPCWARPPWKGTAADSMSVESAQSGDEAAVHLQTDTLDLFQRGCTACMLSLRQAHRTG